MDMLGSRVIISCAPDPDALPLPASVPAGRIIDDPELTEFCANTLVIYLIC
jgi:hypothetical protein